MILALFYLVFFGYIQPAKRKAARRHAQGNLGINEGSTQKAFSRADSAYFSGNLLY
jgi:hypothetical protein